MGDTKVKVSLHEGTFEIEGTQQFVESHWNELKSFFDKPHTHEKPHVANKSVPKTPAPKGNQKKSKITATPISVDVKKTEKKPAFRDLYNEKNPSTDMEIVTLIAFYLKKYLDINDVEFGHASFIYTVIQKKRPKDFLATFKNAMTLKAWVQRGTKPNSFTITSTGEDFITFELPQKKS